MTGNGDERLEWTWSNSSQNCFKSFQPLMRVLVCFGQGVHGPKYYAILGSVQAPANVVGPLVKVGVECYPSFWVALAFLIVMFGYLGPHPS